MRGLRRIERVPAAAKQIDDVPDGGAAGQGSRRRDGEQVMIPEALDYPGSRPAGPRRGSNGKRDRPADDGSRYRLRRASVPRRAGF